MHTGGCVMIKIGVSHFDTNKNWATLTVGGKKVHYNVNVHFYATRKSKGL